MPEDFHARSARIDLRLTPTAKSLLEQAAAARHKTVSEFMLDHAILAAKETLADRRIYRLDDEQWAEVNRRLETAPRDMPRLKALAARSPSWTESK